MIEPTQVLLFSVVTILTVILVLIGWQIFQILSEIRKMMMKFNTMVDGAVTVTRITLFDGEHWEEAMAKLAGDHDTRP